MNTEIFYIALAWGLSTAVWVFLFWHAWRWRRAQFNRPAPLAPLIRTVHRLSSEPPAPSATPSGRRDNVQALTQKPTDTAGS
ncbi:MAG: heme exporter protein CcmD [Gammaproteobacteria bacterium]|nr:heme exporter protein CcmD [Pseudomonadota bacterium]MCH9664168.1 heme exporter protein CcmD [Gammaproteobacteria bacterium]